MWFLLGMLILEANVVSWPNSMASFSASSNCSRSGASWPHGLDSVKGSEIVRFSDEAQSLWNVAKLAEGTCIAEM